MFWQKPRNKVYYEIVNTGALQKAVDDKRLDAGKGIDREALVAAGLVRVNGAPTRILGMGELTASLNITAHSVSAGAKEMVQKAGGSVTIEAAPVEAAE